MKKRFLTFIIFGIIAFHCTDPENVVSPSHYTRVPVPVGLTATTDTTVTGAAKITLNWTVSSMENIKSFEISRAVSATDTTGRASATKYTIIQPPVTVTTKVDSFSAGKGKFYVYYTITPTGKDRFVGKGSDTLKVIFIK